MGAWRRRWSMEYDRLKKRYFLELQEQLTKSERRHVEETEQLSHQLAYQIQYNNSLLEHLQQLEQQNFQAQNVIVEARKLLAKTTSERDEKIGICLFVSCLFFILILILRGTR